MTDITVDFATYTSYTNTNGPYSSSDNVTLADTSSVLNGLTTADIDALATNNVDFINATDGVLTWDADQYSHLITGSVTISPDTFAVLSDTSTNIEALTATQIAGLASHGVSFINPSDATLSLHVDQFNALGAMNVDSSADFTIADTGANLAGMSAGQIGSLHLLGVDHLDATDNVLSLTVSQYTSLGTVTLTAGDTVTLADSGANLSALTSTQIGNLAGNGIDIIDATDDTLSLSVAQYNALGTVTLTAGDTVTLADTGANLAALTTGQIDALANIDIISATDTNLTLSVDQFNHIIADSIALASGNTVTISDSAANLGTLTFSALAGENVDYLNSTDAYTTLTVANLTALGTVAFTSSSSVTLTDTGANIAGVSDFSTFASHGVDTLDASDNALTITVAQFHALGTVALSAGDTNHIQDSFVDFLGMSTTDIAALSSQHVSLLHSLDGTKGFLWNVDQWAHLGSGITIDSVAGKVGIVDTAGNIEALTVTQIDAFHAAGLNEILDVNFGGTLSFSVVQTAAILADGIVVGSDPSPGTVIGIVSDTGAHIAGLTATQIGELSGAGFGTIDATDDTLSLSVAQYNALGTVSLTAGDTVTLADSGANLAALTTGQIDALTNIDIISATDTNLTLSVDQYNHIISDSIALADGNNVTISDTAANLATLDFSTLATNHVDHLDSTDAYTALTVANLTDLGTVTFTSGSNVTLTDTGANIAAVSDFSTFGSHGIDTLDASNDALTISVTQYTALGTTHLTGADAVTIADTAVNIEAYINGFFSAGQLTTALTANGVDTLDATDAPVTIAYWSFVGLHDAGVAFASGDTVTLSDTGANIAFISDFSTYAATGVDVLDASDDVLTISATQFGALGTTTLTAGDTVTISDTAANLAGLTFSGLAAANVDYLNSTDAYTSLTVANLTALGTVVFTDASNVTLTDTGANIASVSDFSTFAAHGVDTINSSTDLLTVTVAQLSALGTTHLTGGDTVLLVDTAANLTTYLDGSDASTQLLANGVDTIHSTTGSALTVDAAAITHVAGTGATFATGDTVTLSDTGANIAALNFSYLPTLHVDTIDASDDVLTISTTQFNALGTTTLTAGDNVTISDTAANLAGLASSFSTLASANVDHLDATTAYTTLTVTNLTDLGTVTFTDASSVTLTDTGANIEAVSDFSVFASHGVDVLNASDNSLTISVAQFDGLGTTTLTAGDDVTISDTASHLSILTFSALAGANVDHLDATSAISVTVLNITDLGTVDFTSASAVTLADTGANIAAVSDFSTFAAHGVDMIDASDNALTISVAQYGALGSVALTAGDTVTISDTAAHLATLDFSTLAGANVDYLASTDVYTGLTVADLASLGTVSFTAGSLVAVTDTAAHIVALSDFSTFAAHGVDAIIVSDTNVTISVAQYDTLGATVFAAGDNVTISDTGANLATLDFSTLRDHGIDTLDASDNTLSLTVAQYEALNGVHLTGADTVTLADTGANLATLTATQIGYLAANGVDALDASNNVLSLAVAQFNALGTVALTGTDVVTILDTGANLATLDFSTLASKGVDVLDASDNVLTITAAQFNALGTVSLKASDVVTLQDTGADISSLTAGQINALASKGIDIIDTGTDNFSLTVAQVNGLSSALTLTGTGTLTLADTEANIEAMTQAQLAAAAARGVDLIHATDTSTLHITETQILGVVGTSMAFASGDTVSLYDTGANIALLTSTQIGQLHAAGVDSIDASNNTLTLTYSQFASLNGVTLTSGDVVTLQDDNGTLTGLSAETIQGLSAAGIDILQSLTAQHNFTFDYAQTEALLHQTGGGTLQFASTDTLYVSDTGANISSLTAAELTTLGGLGGEGGTVDLIASSAFTFTVAQYGAAFASGVVIDTTDNVTLSGSNTELHTLDLSQLYTKGIDHISATDAATFNLTDLTNIGGNIDLTGSSTYTLSDAEGTIEGLTGTQLGGFAGQGIDVISSSGGTLVLDASQVSGILSTGATFDTANDVTLSDTATNIEALSSTDFSALASHGVDHIDASDNALALTAAQFHGLGAVTLSSGDTNTISDTLANLAGMSTTDIAALYGQHISGVHSTDATNGLEWSVAQWSALHSGITLDSASGTVAVFDTVAHLDTLTAANIGAFYAEGLTDIIASNAGTVSFDVNATAVILADSITVSSNVSAFDIAILADTGANLTGISTTLIDALHGAGFASIDATDNVVSFAKTQIDHMLSGSIALTQADTVTMTDTAADLQTFTATNFSDYITFGVDVFNAGGNNVLLGEAQVAAVLNGGASFYSGDSVALQDTAANIETLTPTQFGQLASHGVDAISVTSGTLVLSVADYQALGAFDISGLVELVDTGADIATLSTTQLAALTGTGVTQIDATDNTMSLTAAQASAILNQTGAGTVALTNTDAVTIADTGAHIAGMSVGDLTALGTDGAGSVTLDASDNVLTITAAQYAAITGNSIALTSGDYVSLSDTGANLAALDSTALAALATNHVDAVVATDHAISLTAAQLDAFNTAGIALTASDTITLSDTEAHIEALTGTQLAGYVTQGVDSFSSSGGTLSLSADQVTHVVDNGASFASGNDVTLTDTGANIQALTATQIGELAGQGVDHIDASDNAFSLSVSQYNALGATTLTGGDTVTLADTGANLAALTTGQLGHLFGNGIDVIDATDNALSLSVAQYGALGLDSSLVTSSPGPTHVTLTPADVVTLADTGAHLAALTSAQIGNLAANGIDVIDATDNALSLSVSQFDALGTVALTGGDNIVLSDTGANLAGLSASAISALAGLGVDSLDASDNALALTVAQYQALGAVALTAGDTVTLNDTGANIASLSAAEISGLAAAGIDAIDASDNAVTFSLDQYDALGSLSLAANDVITVNGTSGDDVISGTAHSDILVGMAGNDVLLGHGGNDTLIGGTGNNTLNGGAGFDTVDYSGSSSGVTVNLLKGVADNGHGTDILTSIESVIGSSQADKIVAGTGVNHVQGLGGDDTFIFGSHLTAADHINGGSGNDTLKLSGNYSSGLHLAGSTLTGVETIDLGGGHSYNLTTSNGNVANGQTLTVDGSALGTHDHLVFHGNAETNGSFVLTGGAGNDTLVGGHRGDVLEGGGGKDHLVGGGGADHFVYTGAADSTGSTFDTISGFDSRHDSFSLPSTITGVDTAIEGGGLSRGHFDANLANAVNASNLAANHAVLFTPDAGNLHGQVFLVVDMNGQAGYQAGADLVIHLANPTDLAHLDVTDFT